MATLGSAADFARKLDKVGNALPRGYREGVFKGALATKDIFLAHAARAGLTPGEKIRGVGKSGAKWGVGFDMKGGIANPVAVVKSRGPVWLVEGPVKAHPIVPRRRRGTRALRLGDRYAASVSHPGTPGKRFAANAKRNAAAVVPSIIAREVRQSILRTGFGR